MSNDEYTFATDVSYRITEAEFLVGGSSSAGFRTIPYMAHSLNLAVDDNLKDSFNLGILPIKLYNKLLRS